MTTMICIESAPICFEFFLKHFDSFKPINKITCFFDSENFLTTNYNINSDFVHMIIENFCGMQIHLNLNCGYGGTGPSATEKLLIFIGVNTSLASECKLAKGFELIFSDDGTIKNDRIYHNIFFESENLYPKIRKNSNSSKFILDKYSKINTTKRIVYIINPQLNCMDELLSCLYIMEPIELEFFIGNNSIMENGLSIGDVFSTTWNNNFVINNMDIINCADRLNLKIRGDKFNILCFIDPRELLSTLQIIHLYLLKKPLFNENLYSNYCIFGDSDQILNKIIFFFKWLFNKYNNGYYKSIKIPRDGRSIWKI